MEQQHTVLIVGAGLTGLTLAYLLKKQGISATLLEARPRIGGRIETIHGANSTPIEMGATWFGNKHEYLIGLLDELQVGYFPQFQQGIGLFESMSFTPAHQFEMPQGEEPSYRIIGGTQRLIDQLVKQIGHENIVLHAPVKAIVRQDEGWQIETEKATYDALTVVSTLSPKLFIETIQVTPALPENTVELCANTHTWMGESTKFAVEYARPFWREQGFSGAIFSQTGIANEIHDHTNYEQNTFALKGFLSSGANNMSQEQRQAAVIEQLHRLLGEGAKGFTGYYEKLWANEAFTTP